MTKILANFGYTGGVQSYTVPAGCAGNYLLQVWGAQGATTVVTGGAGGYSYGYVRLNAGTTIYVVVGGAGSCGYGGYNGGASTRGATVAGQQTGNGYARITFASY